MGMDSVPGVEECCGLTYIIKSVVVTSHANVFIWHQTVPTFPCDRLISSKISHPPEGKEILRDILLHTHRCRKETGNHWGHICVEIQSLRRLTHKFLTTGVRQLHSFRGQQQCNEHRTESLGIEKPHPSLSCLTSSLVFFLARVLKSPRTCGNYNQVEKQNLRGGEEPKGKCLCPQF